jgi:hypothetical protein
MSDVLDISYWLVIESFSSFPFKTSAMIAFADEVESAEIEITVYCAGYIGPV